MCSGYREGHPARVVGQFEKLTHYLTIGVWVAAYTLIDRRRRGERGGMALGSQAEA